MLNEEGNIFSSLPKRRQFDIDHLQSIVQVFAKSPLVDHLFHVPVRCRDDPHINGVGIRIPQRSNLSLLDHPEQFRLEHRRHFGDLVQEKCPFIGFKNQSLLICFRIGEGSSFIAEQLTLKERFRNGCTIDRDEGALFSDTGIMDRLWRPTPCRSRFPR